VQGGVTGERLQDSTAQNRAVHHPPGSAAGKVLVVDDHVDMRSVSTSRTVVLVVEIEPTDVGQCVHPALCRGAGGLGV
jgi:hypothetical protein